MKTVYLSNATAEDLGVLLANLTPAQIADCARKCAVLYTQTEPLPMAAVVTDYEMRFRHASIEVEKQLRVSDEFQAQCG